MKKARAIKKGLPTEQAVRDAIGKKAFLTRDGYQNVLANLGINTDNQSAAGSYGFGGFITRQRLVLEAAYRTSWIIGQVVDVVAEDMTRAGMELTNEFSPEDLDHLQRQLVDRGVWEGLTNAIKWGRLYGGGVAILLIDGQRMDTPLEIETVGRGSFKGLLALDRWLLNPSLGNLVPQYGPDFGMPKFYNILSTSFVMPTTQIHYTRLVRFGGIELPYLWKQAENLWDESVVERMWDRLLAFDSTTQGAAQLVFKAHLRTIRAKGLREILAAGGVMEQALIKQFEYIRRFQSNEGITLLDAEDEFETHQYAFSGLSDLLVQFGQQISGSTGIPLVRLFGQSPAGLNATGEADLRTYYDTVNKEQERKLKKPLLKILNVLSMSELGKPLPPETTIKFNPLWQLQDGEKATIASTDGSNINNLFNSGIISRAIALKELRQQSHITGRFSNITTEDIEKAEQEPETPKGELSGFESGPFTKDEFKETEHPREDDGKFTTGAGTPLKKKTDRTLKPAENREAWPEHILALKIPPAWKDVQINEDPDGDLLAVGKDAKGRSQYVYSRKFAESQAALKFARMKSLQEDISLIREQLSDIRKSKNEKDANHADCAWLIEQMGIRPGGDTDTKAKVKAYGATTLEGRHVVVEEKKVFLRFTGKKGVSINLEVTNPELAENLLAHKRKAGPEGHLFSEVKDSSLLDFVHTLDHGGYKTKDFRTLLANKLAAEEVIAMSIPKTGKDYKKAVMAVAKKVSARLGNTPTVALQSYISPAIFGAWRGEYAS